MTKLILDIPDEYAASLEERAKAFGRSAEAEAFMILSAYIRPKDRNAWEKLDKLREQLRVRGYSSSVGSTELIRQDRDSR